MHTGFGIGKLPVCLYPPPPFLYTEMDSLFWLADKSQFPQGENRKSLGSLPVITWLAKVSFPSPPMLNSAIESWPLLDEANVLPSGEIWIAAEVVLPENPGGIVDISCNKSMFLLL